MEETQQTEKNISETSTPQKKPQKKTPNQNNKKSRTHVPVKGLTIDQLRGKNTL